LPESLTKGCSDLEEEDDEKVEDKRIFTTISVGRCAWGVGGGEKVSLVSGM